MRLKSIVPQNKRAMGIVGWIIVAIVIIVGVGGVTYVVTQTGLPDKEVTEREALDCETAPSLSYAIVDAINPGTVVSTVQDMRLNGVYLGTLPSSHQIGDKAEVLVNASNYISVIIPEFTIDRCGITTVPGQVYATDDPTFAIFNDGGDPTGDCVTASNIASGTNQSSSTTNILMELRITAGSDQSTGDLVIVLEADNRTEVNDFDFNGISAGTSVTPCDVPSFYTQNASTSRSKAFCIPAVINGARADYQITLEPGSGETIAGTILYVTSYSEQAFVDIDGTFKVGIEDIDGTTKYEDTLVRGVNIV